LCATFEDIGRFWQLQLTDPYYLAPELRLRQPVNQQTDLYGLGMVLQVMLTGLKSEQFSLRSDLRELPQLAQRARSVKITERPLNCLDFANELLSIIAPLPSETHAMPIPDRLLQGLLIIMILFSLMSLLLLFQS